MGCLSGPCQSNAHAEDGFQVTRWWNGVLALTEISHAYAMTEITTVARCLSLGHYSHCHPVLKGKQITPLFTPAATLLPILANTKNINHSQRFSATDNNERKPIMIVFTFSGHSSTSSRINITGLNSSMRPDSRPLLKCTKKWTTCDRIRNIKGAQN